MHQRLELGNINKEHSLVKVNLGRGGESSSISDEVDKAQWEEDPEVSLGFKKDEIFSGPFSEMCAF